MPSNVYVLYMFIFFFSPLGIVVSIIISIVVTLILRAIFFR